MERNTHGLELRLPSMAGLLFLVSLAGCATTGVAPRDGKPLIPTAFQVRTGPYVICTNQKLEATASVVKQLQLLETQLSETLGVQVEPGTNPVEVYILDDRKSFEHFLTFYYPELPHRRAFFLANGNQRVVYTFFGERLEEDLRHEATHALLHARIGDIPLWLDEGLAEYFESPTDRKGVNAEHLARLPEDIKGGWSPSLTRLESLKGVTQMTPRDYRESWAWVHYLLNGGKVEKSALLGYLSELRMSPDARPISSRLEVASAEPLLAHITRVEQNPVALEDSAPRDSTVRFQSGVTETPVIQPRRKSLFSKVRDLFGP